MPLLTNVTLILTGIEHNFLVNVECNLCYIVVFCIHGLGVLCAVHCVRMVWWTVWVWVHGLLTAYINRINRILNGYLTFANAVGHALCLIPTK